MFAKKAIGLFLGSQGLSIVETTGAGKIKNYFYNLYPKEITKPGGAIFPRDNIFDVFLDNEVEIIAFLQRSIRDSRVSLENNEIVVCIPSRDLIVRFFEIPPIPRKDIKASIGFEIKKYIPFKTEEITFDYQTYPQKNIIAVLFAGIKNEDLQKYSSILTQLNIKILAIEPSQFSFFRLLKIKKIISNKEAVVIIELEREEGGISIIDNGIPCFSRDIKIFGGPEATEVDMETVSFRIINEARVSMDYFRRQFLKKGIDRILIISKDESKELINAFNKELGIPVHYHNPDNIFGIKEEYSLNLAKALGASFRMSKPTSLFINLNKIKKEKAKSGGMPLALSKEMVLGSLEEILNIPKPIIILSLSFALLALAALFAFGNFKQKPLNQQLQTLFNEANSIIINELKGLDVNGLTSLKNVLKDKLAIYESVFKKDFFIYEKLEILPKLIPEGVWLEEISFDKENKFIYFRGLAYKEDDKKAAEAPYTFIANLKNSPLFFNKIEFIRVKSLRSDAVTNYRVNRFEIEIKISGK